MPHRGNDDPRAAAAPRAGARNAPPADVAPPRDEEGAADLPAHPPLLGVEDPPVLDRRRHGIPRLVVAKALDAREAQAEARGVPAGGDGADVGA